jgi:hypothetical protein
MRLLTGGINSSDKDNEWCKIIAESSLNNTILAGSNDKWNWSGLYSWTSTTSITASTARVNYGSTAVSTWNYFPSDYTQPTVGFRPVLLVKEKSIHFLARLADGKIYGMKSV